MKAFLSINCRNEESGHWDIHDESKRLCKIRGEEGNFAVYNDYGGIPDKEGFVSIYECIKYIWEFFTNGGIKAK